MRTIRQTPTRPANYALISGIYATALSGVTLISRRTGNAPSAGALGPLGVATFTFTRVLSEQKVEEWIRRPFVDEPGDASRTPRGSGMRYAIGELLSCTRCTGSWVGLGLLGLHAASPKTARMVAAAGTIGAINDTALAGFAWLSGRANATGELAARRHAESVSAAHSTEASE
ncbi:DUF1360 domain-containing protein [Patulibacter minatonensis]|uniref:DUF1360 domain-containing protein n=1 Tax=Patulibacter minatonensis TaxID=298163 RepID=UPI0006840283|nr:DUF1360 domain-containing protein [Patulibacter minatonensis]